MVADTEPLHVIYLAVQLVSAIWNVKIAVEPGYMTLIYVDVGLAGVSSSIFTAMST
jgi:hypothetical protein